MALPTASDNVWPKLIGAEAAAPGTPAAATAILYVKADGLWYSKDDAGVETLVSGGAGGAGAPTTSKYVVTEADAGLSAEQVHPELLLSAAGSDVDMAAAATGTSVTASVTDGLTTVSFSAASWQYWDVASAIGTGDFDARMRIVDVGPTGVVPTSVLFVLMLTDGSRTQSTSLGVQIIGKGAVATVPKAQGVVNVAGVGTAVGQITFPIIARMVRVGTTVTFYVSSNEGRFWYQLGATSTSSLNVGKIGAWMHPNTGTSGSALVHWIRTV